MTRASLSLRFLGEVEVLRDGAAVPLPPSKKTRALLAYLSIAGARHRRERLCSLLWDVADDPRGALRWSLSKLRAIVDEPGLQRIAADRDGVSFQSHGASIDVHAIRKGLAGGADAIPLEELESLAGTFRGEFLEGLDLSDFHDFHAWCVALREDCRVSRAAVLGSLVRRLEADPDRALPYARSLVQVDPLDPSARARLLALLAASGRHREAAEHHATARRILEEAAPGAAAALDAAWKEIGAKTRSIPAPALATDTEGGPAAAGADRARVAPLVGREAELALVREWIEAVAAKRRERVVLMAGEPGIGKSRLLAAVVADVRGRGGLVLEGRCYEAERGRPYVPWVEALRRLPPASLGDPLASALAPLLHEPAAPPGGGTAGGSDTRERLFGAVVDLVAARASGPAPLLVAFDDLQWCDAASAELLHFVARSSLHRPVLLALAAREGELMDNDPVRRLLRGLRLEGLSETLPLGPLGRVEIESLARALGSDADAERLYAESRGNPLFATELARAGRREPEEVPPRLEDVVRDRIDRLAPAHAEVLRWSAALGCAFQVDRLARVASLDPDRLLPALESLERHALLRAAGDSGGGGYAFAHDVVRRVVYSDLSEPRRRLMHGKISGILREGPAGDEGAADLAHHAALAGDAATAAAACVAAGRRCLRLFAGAEAGAMARRGARFAEELAEPDRTRRLIELAEVRLSAKRPETIESEAVEIEALAERALDLGCAEHARLGFHLLGWLRWEEGDATGAGRHMMRAESISRAGDDRQRAAAMGEAARCLALLEKDLAHAEALAREAASLSKRAGFDHASIADALGMLRLHKGRPAEAAEHFRRARSLSRRDRDPMGEFMAIEHLIAVELERGDPAAARTLAADLAGIGEKMREGSEAPFARAVEALCRWAAGETAARADLAGAIDSLRDADAKQRLAQVLVRASRLDLERGDRSAARSRAEEALALAQALNLTILSAAARSAIETAAGRKQGGKR